MKPPKPHAMDYFVPDFGMDREILDNHADLTVAENALKHKWIWNLLPKEAFDRSL